MKWSHGFDWAETVLSVGWSCHGGERSVLQSAMGRYAGSIRSQTECTWMATSTQGPAACVPTNHPPLFYTTRLNSPASFGKLRFFSRLSSQEEATLPQSVARTSIIHNSHKCSIDSLHPKTTLFIRFITRTCWYVSKAHYQNFYAILWKCLVGFVVVVHSVVSPVWPSMALYGRQTPAQVGRTCLCPVLPASQLPN